MNPKEAFEIYPQHVGMHVRSIDETYDWYHRVFGFERRPKPNHGGKNPFAGGVFPKMEFVWLGNFALELYEVQNAEPYSLVDLEFTHGVKHVNFHVNDVDAWLEYVKQFDDVEVMVRNNYGPTAGCAYVKDCNGILVEVTSD